MKVAVLSIKEDGTGSIDIYEIDAKRFNEMLTEIAPSENEDWFALWHRIEKEGKLITTTSPDYSFKVDLP